MRMLLIVCASFFATILSGWTHAHKAGDSYLDIRVDNPSSGKIQGQWDIALRDLNAAIDLGGNNGGALQWSRIERNSAAMSAYAMSRLTLAADGAACKSAIEGQSIDERRDGAYAVIRFAAECPAGIGVLDVHYRLLFDTDPEHRGLLKLTTPEGSTSAIFPIRQPRQSFRLSKSRMGAQLAGFIGDGIRHIAIGFDHILFLLTLLLPAMLVREGRLWRPASTMKKAILNVAGIVTAFTFAHSITLGLATLGIVAPSTRWVESLIAASVAITAIDNIVPCLPRRRWLVALAFGLVHGFGFAGVLQDLNLPRADLLTSLIGFNIGVEIGQLVMVVLVVPIAYSLRASAAYHRLAVAGGSLAIATIAAGWFFERALQLSFMPF